MTVAVYILQTITYKLPEISISILRQTVINIYFFKSVITVIERE